MADEAIRAALARSPAKATAALRVLARLADRDDLLASYRVVPTPRGRRGRPPGATRVPTKVDRWVWIAHRLDIRKRDILDAAGRATASENYHWLRDAVHRVDRYMALPATQRLFDGEHHVRAYLALPSDERKRAVLTALRTATTTI